MSWIESIISEAKRIGACNMADGVRTEEELVGLLFSAQGREFCSRHEFPSRKTWDSLEHHGLENHNVFINEGRFGLDISLVKDVAVIGDTDAHLYVDGTYCGHTIIVGHGADVRITAFDYAVFEVVKIGQCKVDVTLDETAIQL